MKERSDLPIRMRLWYRNQKNPSLLSRFMGSDDSKKWHDEIKEEFKLIDQNDVWELIKLHNNYKKKFVIDEFLKLNIA